MVILQHVFLSCLQGPIYDFHNPIQNCFWPWYKDEYSANSESLQNQIRGRTFWFPTNLVKEWLRAQVHWYTNNTYKPIQYSTIQIHVRSSPVSMVRERITWLAELTWVEPWPANIGDFTKYGQSVPRPDPTRGVGIAHFQLWGRRQPSCAQTVPFFSAWIYFPNTVK